MLANMISRRGYLWFDYLLLGTVQIEAMRYLSVDAAWALGLSRLRLRVGTPCVLYSAGMDNLSFRAWLGIVLAKQLHHEGVMARVIPEAALTDAPEGEKRFQSPNTLKLILLIK
jgi:hypothetical protein